MEICTFSMLFVPVCVNVCESLSYIIVPGLLHGWLTFVSVCPCGWCREVPRLAPQCHWKSAHAGLMSVSMCVRVCWRVHVHTNVVSAHFPLCVCLLLYMMTVGNTEGIWQASGKVHLRLVAKFLVNLSESCPCLCFLDLRYFCNCVSECRRSLFDHFMSLLLWLQHIYLSPPTPLKQSADIRKQLRSPLICSVSIF